jgi:hypothetical protein
MELLYNIRLPVSTKSIVQGKFATKEIPVVSKLNQTKVLGRRGNLSVDKIY